MKLLNQILEKSKNIKLFSCILCASILVSCGSIPRAKVTYYQTQTKVYFKVTQTFNCDADDHPFHTATATPTVVHSADTLKDPYESVDLEKLRKIFTDTDIKFDFYEDGRLKSINSTSTGQGETILKTAATMLTTILPMDGEDRAKFSDECTFIKDAGNGKPISITYSGEVIPTLETINDITTLLPEEGSSYFASKLANITEGACVVTTNIVKPPNPFEYQVKKDDVLISGRQPAQVTFAVGNKFPGGCTEEIWKGNLSVAQLGREFKLPVPHSALFGKVSISATFDPSGGISSLQYLSGSGVAGGLNGITSLATYLKGSEETTASKAMNVKAEADLIMQQQRLLACRANPSECE